MKTIIKDGYLIDGTGKERYKADLLIEDDKVQKIAPTIEAVGAEIIDASGKIVCPGFIDTHSHSDLKLLEEAYLKPKLLQGITTEILGQDGVSMAPVPKAYFKSWQKNIAGLEGDSKKAEWVFETTKDYLKALEENKIVSNAAYLVPHGNIRMEAMGLSDTVPSKEELVKMKEVLKRELEAGAIGLSSGLIYIPCTYAKTEELIELCKVVKDYDGIFVVHQRSESNDILKAMDEVLEIGRKSGVRIHFSHFKVCGKRNWDKIPLVIKKLDEAKREGLEVSFDQYPYVAGSTMLSVVLPPWVHVGGTEELLKRLQDEELVAKIDEEIQQEDCNWDNFVDFAGWDNIYITYVKSKGNQQFIGKDIEEIGRSLQISPLQAAIKLIIEEENTVTMVDFYGKEEHIELLMKRPEQNVCTDGILQGNPHPRAYGTYPRILGRYVREKGILTLEEAIYKMTFKAATSFGLKRRGALKEGFIADIVIFDPNTIKDRGTYEEPKVHPEGIESIFINGNLVFDKEVKPVEGTGLVIKNANKTNFKRERRL